MESAAREAQAYFGRPEIYLERYLSWPRHVEMQILADQHGTTLWLGERDCSAQRRHQKLIEESPAPDFPDEIRQAMGAAAVTVSQACGYYNAGTVEFLYQEGEFYFLEMNTRLQVEHPVTELVTGLDLVAWQIRIASGEQLDFAQEDVRRDGHAIEVRINAEDPSGGRFSPSPGTLTSFHEPSGPASASTAATNPATPSRSTTTTSSPSSSCGPPTGRRHGAACCGPSAETRITGVATTLPADEVILSHPDFASAAHSTKWVEERLDLSGLTAPGTGAGAGRRRRADRPAGRDGRGGRSPLLGAPLGPRPRPGGAGPPRPAGTNGRQRPPSRAPGRAR